MMETQNTCDQPEEKDATGDNESEGDDVPLNVGEDSADSTFADDPSQQPTATRHGKKRKRTKYKKAPQAPRRFKSAYMFFSTDKHKEIRQDYNEKGISEKTTNIAKLVSQAWKELPADERSRYDEMARKDKARFEVEKTLYTGPWKVPAKKRSQKDPNAPKRPMSAFLSYSHAKRAEVKKENPHMSNAEISRILAQRWKEASDEEKKEHVDLELKLRQKYLTEIAAWRKNAEEEMSEQRRQREEYAMKAVDSGVTGGDAPLLSAALSMQASGYYGGNSNPHGDPRGQTSPAAQDRGVGMNTSSPTTAAASSLSSYYPLSYPTPPTVGSYYQPYGYAGAPGYASAYPPYYSPYYSQSSTYAADPQRSVGPDNQAYAPTPGSAMSSDAYQQAAAASHQQHPHGYHRGMQSSYQNYYAGGSSHQNYSHDTSTSDPYGYPYSAGGGYGARSGYDRSQHGYNDGTQRPPSDKGENSGLGRSDSNSGYYSSGYNEHSSAYGASGRGGGYGLPNSNQGAYESGGQHQSDPRGGEAYDLRSSNHGQDQQINIHHHDQHRSSQGRGQETATRDSMMPYLPINDRTDNNSRGPHQPRPAVDEPYYNSNESGAVSREPHQGQEPEGSHMYQYCKYNANRQPERSWDGGGVGEDSNDGGTQEVSI